MFHKKSVCLRRYLVCVFMTASDGVKHFVYVKDRQANLFACLSFAYTNTAGADAVLCRPMYRYVRQPSESVSCMEHTYKIRFPKSGGRNFLKFKETATENTINPLISVAFYFLKDFIIHTGYGFRVSEIYSNIIPCRAFPLKL